MKRRIGIGFLLAFIFFIALSYYFIASGLPTYFSIVKGDQSTILSKLPLSFNVSIEGMENLDLELNGESQQNNYLVLSSGHQLTVKGDKVGTSSLNFKLLGFIPIKSITVNIIPEVDVYPGGQAIGVLLRSKGVMVVGRSFVEGEDGQRYYPAQEAGIEVGDVIVGINNQEINDKIELSNLIQEISRAEGVVNLRVKRKNKLVEELALSAIKDKKGQYMIGLYVDDGVAGVGTLTFYEPKKGEYGALGHEITEANSQSRIEVREGKIIEARISGINSGRKGLPGEKLGTFFHLDNVIGEIQQNSKFGIFGKLNKNPVNPYFKKPIPVAPISEVKRGPAKIYTVVEGGKIEEFDVKIERVNHQSLPRDKGMIINITDPRLKKITGGIIQGMSGSPIVQNNKLVGAITHVFVNEPTRGYGVFAEWMLLQTDLYNQARASNY